MRLLVLFWISSIGHSFLSQDYCSIPCGSTQHTMCIYKSIGEKCHRAINVIDSRARTEIVKLHNLLRNAVASGKWRLGEVELPPSSNMRELFWDFELESIAERWALQCNDAHNDKCRDVRRFKVGQVMSKSKVLTHSHYHETLLRNIWFAEINNLDEDAIPLYRGENYIKHIAQILFAGTSRMGCADVIYEAINNQTKRRITVCNYGPAIQTGQAIYEEGKPCKRCPRGTQCQDSYWYPHLCSESRYHIEEINLHINISHELLAMPLDAVKYSQEVAENISVPEESKSNEESNNGSSRELNIALNALQDSRHETWDRIATKTGNETMTEERLRALDQAMLEGLNDQDYDFVGHGGVHNKLNNSNQTKENRNDVTMPRLLSKDKGSASTQHLSLSESIPLLLAYFLYVSCVF